MSYSIQDLFVAIHYCNKMVKGDTFVGVGTKKDFYHKKRDLLYHMIRNHKELGIEISDCHIDMQNNLIKKKPNRLYAFCLTHDDAELKVHQREYSKLAQLFQILGFTFEVTGDYTYTPDESLTFNRELFNESLNIIKDFHNKWNLESLIGELHDPNVPIEKIFDSFVYYYPDFSFNLEMKGSTMGKHTVVQVRHIPSGRSYRLSMSALRARGEIYLQQWRHKHIKYKVCL